MNVNITPFLCTATFVASWSIILRNKSKNSQFLSRHPIHPMDIIIQSNGHNGWNEAEKGKHFLYFSPTWRHQFPSIVQPFSQFSNNAWWKTRRYRERRRRRKLFLISFSSSLIYSFSAYKARRKVVFSLHPTSPSSHFCIIRFWRQGRSQRWGRINGWGKKSETLDGHQELSKDSLEFS